ncbi:MAG: hypothetical protein DI582_03890 [Azospirillum brasilense]|nr:MAG: hypothetical protein DI582_03890 [Azospirillum brasilense]
MSTVPPPAAGMPAISALGTPFAGFWIRFVAAIIDGLILFIPNFVVGILLAPAAPAAGQAATSNPLASLVSLGIYIAYYTALQGGKWQATVGKRVVGIHVMRTDGSRISHLRALGRYFASFLSAITLLIGYIMAGFTREKTTLHDLICDTRVVYGKR